MVRHRNFSGFFPFAIEGVTPSQLASIQAVFPYPVPVPISQICKWWWLAKSFSIEATNTWSYADPLYGYSGSGADSFEGTFSFQQFRATALNAAVPAQRTVAGASAFNRFNGTGAGITASVSPPVGTFSETVDGTTTTGDYSPTFGLTVLAPYGFYPYNVPSPVVLCEGEYYPCLQLTMYGSVGYSATTLAGSAPSIGSCTFDGLTLPLYGKMSTGLPIAEGYTTTYAATLSVTLDTLWTP